MIGIYKITNPKGKIYVGKSKNIEKRFKDYINPKCKTQRKLYNSLLKYGPENHKFEIIEECKENQLNEREIYWINFLDCIKKGLNLTEGGDGGKISKESEERRRLNKMKPVIQYDLQGKFIKEHKGASEAVKYLGKGNGNNINDCARGKYRTTYGFIWEYKDNQRTEKERLKFINLIQHRSNLGSKMSKITKQKISKSRMGKNFYTKKGIKNLSKSKKGNKFANKKIKILKNNKLIKIVDSRKEAMIYVKINYGFSYANCRDCLQFNKELKNIKLEYE